MLELQPSHVWLGHALLPALTAHGCPTHLLAGLMLEHLKAQMLLPFQVALQLDNDIIYCERIQCLLQVQGVAQLWDYMLADIRFSDLTLYNSRTVVVLEGLIGWPVFIME
jgi:hypothetical protein